MYLPVKSLLCGLLILGSCYLVYSTRIGFVNYDVGNAVPFKGSNLTNTGSGCVDSMFHAQVLECSPGAKLDDGFTGPVDSVFNNFTSFFSFSRESGKTGSLTFISQTNIPLSSVHIVLHFFNSPNHSIGLPSVSLTTLNLEPVAFTFDGNNDLSQADSTIRNVTLILDSSAPSDIFVRIAFNFENNSRIDWLLISEVEFFNSSVDPVLDPITFENDLYSVVSLGPERVQSTVSLSCTIVNSGSFEWVWEYKINQLPIVNSCYQVRTADATRTSILEISGLRYTDSGNYTCRVRQQGNNTYFNKTIQLKISQGSSSLVVQSSLAVVQSSSPVVKSSPTTISITTDSPPVTVTSSSSQQVHSTLFSSDVSSESTREHLSSTSTVVSSSSQPQSSSNSNNLPAAIGATFAVVIFILIIIIAIILLVIFYSKRRRKMNTSDLKVAIEGTDPVELKENQVSNNIHEKEKENGFLYSMVVKETPPIIPPQNFDPSDDDDDNFSKQNLSTQKHKSPEPKLTKLSTSDDFDLIDNPVFCENVESNQSIDDPLYSLADFPNVEAQYSLLIDPTDNSYSTADCFKMKNTIYEQADAGVDDTSPFSFISSVDIYNDGPIYSVPEVLTKKKSIAEIGPESLQEMKYLGTGQFGEVVLARTIGLSLKDLGLSPTDDNKEISINVAVKKMKLDSGDSSLVSFEKEMKFMSQLKHKNVVQLLAISRDGLEEPFMVMEYMANGDLNQFLLGHRIAKSLHPVDGELSPQNLLSMAIQIACGMAYLASHNFIHRDVASRNCLVGDSKVVKIADFGLSRNLYDSVYYRVKGKAKMPIRWMATECFYGKFSQFSDVWAYGVTVWEIYTMGREPPYPTLNDEEVVEDALKGEHRMLPTKPAACPKEVYKILRSSCWASDYRKRATFLDIQNELFETESKLYN